MGFVLAYDMNPSGSSMAFVQFNDTLVPAKDFPIYEIADLNGKYPNYQHEKFPIAGENNPIVKLYVRNLNQAENKEIIPPKEVLDWGEYIYSNLKWITDEELR